jgi:endogenous inhibitor of DNA gyrase (YacG/DUF329 family)
MAKAKSKTCPECRKRFRFEGLQAHPWFPFCGERCKTIDLGRWLSNEYAVVEDLRRENDLKDRLDLDDPDVKAALDEL